MCIRKINRSVMGISAVVGAGSWILCRWLYQTYKLRVSGVVLVPVCCTLLFLLLFLSVWAGSVLTGSIDRRHPFYNSRVTPLGYLAAGAAAVLLSAMGLEWLYEWESQRATLSPTSYIFVIDESGSMSGNDKNGVRYDAIREIVENSEDRLPYMVYTFASECRLRREMGTLRSDEPQLENNSMGATAIRQTVLQMLQDYKAGRWEGGGANPKVIFLTDGAATDLDNGFLWFKGNVPEFNAALKDYRDLGINISTVGLGVVDVELMRAMAETTGGVFIRIENVSELKDAMQDAASSYTDRDLLSARYMKQRNGLYGLLRVLFLTLVGTLIGGLQALAYMDEESTPLILRTSAAGALLGSALLEAGIQRGLYQSVVWLPLWLLFALTAGYCYSSSVWMGPGRRRMPGANRRGQANASRAENCCGQRNIRV